MPENDSYTSEPLSESEQSADRKLGRVSCALAGLGWGVATFEGGAALMHFTTNAPIGDYSLKNQLIGLGIFGLGGTTLMGRFIRQQMNETNDSQ